VPHDSGTTPPEKTNALTNYLAGPKFFGSFYKMAALISIALIVGYGINQINKKSAAVTFFSQTGKDRIELPDGSIVTLNAGAEINYPKTFSKNTRLVRFSGEGHFRVHKDTALPFIIRTEKLSIRVLEASLLVKANQNSPEIEVIVESGKVALYLGSDRRKEKTVFTNEKAVFDKALRKINITETTDPHFPAR